MAHHPIKINELFSVVAGSSLVSSNEDKRAIYDTIREILKIKKSLKFRNNIDTILNSDELIDYFIEHYDANSAGKHLDNLDKLYSIYADYLNDIASSSDDDDNDSNIDMEPDKDVKKDGGKDNVIELQVNCYDTSHVQQHVKTRWLLGANTIIAVGNAVLTTYLALKVLNLYRGLCEQDVAM